jgi:RNA polymerase sigma-70 factor (ECF subfamily)
LQPADSPATTTARFESVVLTHLDSAYNLARWLVRGEHDAQDVVQDACLRAFKSFGDFRGVDGRCWLLAIVRNTCCSWLDRNRRDAPAALTDDDLDRLQSTDPDPQRLLLRQADAEQVRQAIEQLPDEFREVVVLREIEGLSYKEIAAVAGVPVGTVMSRLARARQRLARELSPPILLKEARP